MRKKREMHITFHNPNNDIESNKIAEWFIQQAAEKLFRRTILNTKSKQGADEDE